jgi:hypothetical protein
VHYDSSLFFCKQCDQNFFCFHCNTWQHSEKKRTKHIRTVLKIKKVKTHHAYFNTTQDNIVYITMSIIIICSAHLISPAVSVFHTRQPHTKTNNNMKKMYIYHYLSISICVINALSNVLFVMVL